MAAHLCRWTAGAPREAVDVVGSVAQRREHVARGSARSGRNGRGSLEAHRCEHVVRHEQRRGSLAQQGVRAGRERGRDLAGHGENLATLLERELGRDQRAGALPRLDHDHGARRARRRSGYERGTATAPARLRARTPTRSARSRRSAARGRRGPAGSPGRSRSRARPPWSRKPRARPGGPRRRHRGRARSRRPPRPPRASRPSARATWAPYGEHALAPTIAIHGPAEQLRPRAPQEQPPRRIVDRRQQLGIAGPTERERRRSRRSRRSFELGRSPVRERLGEVLRLDLVGSRERGDGLRDPGDPRSPPARQREPVDRSIEELARGGREGRRADGQATPTRTRPARPRRSTRSPGAPRQLARAGPRDQQREIEAIEERAGEPRSVGGDSLRRARARGGGIAARAARAQVHGRDGKEASRVDGAAGNARDADDAVLERLA